MTFCKNLQIYDYSTPHKNHNSESFRTLKLYFWANLIILIKIYFMEKVNLFCENQRNLSFCQNDCERSLFQGVVFLKNSVQKLIFLWRGAKSLWRSGMQHFACLVSHKFWPTLQQPSSGLSTHKVRWISQKLVKVHATTFLITGTIGITLYFRQKSFNFIFFNI